MTYRKIFDEKQHNNTEKHYNDAKNWFISNMEPKLLDKAMIAGHFPDLQEDLAEQLKKFLHVNYFGYLVTKNLCTCNHKCQDGKSMCKIGNRVGEYHCVFVCNLNYHKGYYIEACSCRSLNCQLCSKVLAETNNK
jgi:hypothetical protein